MNYIETNDGALINKAAILALTPCEPEEQDHGFTFPLLLSFSDGFEDRFATYHLLKSDLTHPDKFDLKLCQQFIIQFILCGLKDAIITRSFVDKLIKHEESLGTFIKRTEPSTESKKA